MKRQWHRYTPGVIIEGRWVHPVDAGVSFWTGLYWRFFQLPCSGFFHASFWRNLRSDAKKGFPACGCGLSWFRYRILSTIIGRCCGK